MDTQEAATALTVKHVANICLQNVAGKECRYLCQYEDRSYGCLKRTEYKDKIDKEVNSFLQSGSTAKMPIGDNCNGYPKSKLKQGYDTSWNYLRRWYIDLKAILRSRHDSSRQSH